MRRTFRAAAIAVDILAVLFGITIAAARGIHGEGLGAIGWALVALAYGYETWRDALAWRKALADSRQIREPMRLCKFCGSSHVYTKEPLGVRMAYCLVCDRHEILAEPGSSRGKGGRPAEGASDTCPSNATQEAGCTAPAACARPSPSAGNAEPVQGAAEGDAPRPPHPFGIPRGYEHSILPDGRFRIRTREGVELTGGGAS